MRDLNSFSIHLRGCMKSQEAGLEKARKGGMKGGGVWKSPWGGKGLREGSLKVEEIGAGQCQKGEKSN